MILRIPLKPLNSSLRVGWERGSCTLNPGPLRFASQVLYEVLSLATNPTILKALADRSFGRE